MNLQSEPRYLDAFISYRRSNGSEFASLIERYLKEKNFSVFIDVENLEAGRFDTALTQNIKESRTFVLVLSPNALDRCTGDDLCQDWLHKEIVAGLKYQCEIIPLLHPDFVWPEEQNVPQDMRAIYQYEGIRWDHDYEEAVVDKLVKFIKEAPEKRTRILRSRL